MRFITDHSACQAGRVHRKFSFRRLLEGQKSRVQVIVTFLSILELMKMGG